MDFSSSIPVDSNKIDLVFEKYISDQRDSLAMGKSLTYRGIKLQQAIEDGLVVNPNDPVERIETDPIGGPAQIPVGNTGTFINFGSKPGAWGGNQNGKIDLSGLAVIGKQDKNHQFYKGYYWLRPDAAEAWKRLMDRANQDGIKLTVTSAYRSFEHQASIFATAAAGFAARPGHSNHGWGLAVDIGELFAGDHSLSGQAKTRQTTLYKWLERVGPQFGFFNPPLLRDGRGIDEAWHWEWMGMPK